MKVIVQVVQHLQAGGIETMALDLLNFLGRDNKTMVVSLEGTKQEALLAWPRLKQYEDRLFFINKQSGWDLKAFIRLYRKIKSLNPEAIHTHHIGPLIYGGSCARLLNVNALVHTEHDAWHLENRKRRILQRIFVRALQPKMVADANTVAESIRRYIPFCQPRVIRNGIDTETFIPGNQYDARTRFRLPVDKIIIGCAGRLEQVKGQDVLINAMTLLPKHIHLVLAGSGSQESRLKTLTESLGLADRVHFLGRVDQMVNFYQALDLFCLPSHKEGMPLSPLEAQSCGIPTVLTNTGGSLEALCQITGAHVMPNAPDDMAKKISEVLSKDKGDPRLFVEQQGSVKIMSNHYKTLLLSENNTMSEVSYV